MEVKPKVAFVCVHNSCRSQMAEALGKYYASDIFESYSAGTDIGSGIDKDAVRLIKEIYGIDMEKTQHPKTIDELPKIDVKISMGCDASCPHVQAEMIEDWGLEDPTGRGDEFFRIVIDEIDQRVRDLRESLKFELEAGSRPLGVQ
ncbi:MAG: hypothetical protein PWR17_806 [Candidatus Methanomethylophilaceae archaeon]|nr:hypothetical protein [Candidatus Methanomethylophilaceae archaeon]